MPWLRSDVTGVAVPVVGAFKRFVSGVASRWGDMVCSADALGKLLSGNYMSNKKPVYTITTFKWRALHPSADEARSYLTLAPVIVADDAPVGAAGDAPGGAACDAPASLEPEVSLCGAECAPPHHSHRVRRSRCPRARSRRCARPPRCRRPTQACCQS